MSARAKKNLQREKSPNSSKKNNVGAGKKAKPSLESGSFRIIAGQWRSRRLNFPAVEGLRPTTDRVRETVFNWLNADLPGAHVLDVFSGSGALGLEAVSRGASSLLAIEKNKQAATALQDNINLLLPAPVNTIQVHHADALSMLSRLKESEFVGVLGCSASAFDLVFLDPPFRKGILEETLGLLDGHPRIRPGALIYVEREKELQGVCFPKNWTLLKEKVAGQVSYQLFRVNG